jgi:hypothetical protein
MKLCVRRSASESFRANREEYTTVWPEGPKAKAAQNVASDGPYCVLIQLRAELHLLGALFWTPVILSCLMPPLSQYRILSSVTATFHRRVVPVVDYRCINSPYVDLLWIIAYFEDADVTTGVPHTPFQFSVCTSVANVDQLWLSYFVSQCFFEVPSRVRRIGLARWMLRSAVGW